MASTSLFAPQIRAAQPAFIYKENNGKVKIYFSISPYNTADNIKGIFYTLIDPNIASTWGNNSMIKGSKYKYIDFEKVKKNNDEYYFEIDFNSTDFKALTKNQYYQMQIYFADTTIADKDSGETVDEWFQNNLSYISDASQITLIRPIAELEIVFDIGLDSKNQGTVFNFSKLTGKIQEKENPQNNSIETFDTYSCVFKKFSTSEIIWPSPQIDGNGKNFEINIDNTKVQEDDIYKIQLYYTTIHGYQGYSEEITINYSAPITGGPSIEKLELDKSAGAIKITTTDPGIIQRAVQNDSYWQSLITLSQATSFLDFTVESDVNYQYRIVNSNHQGMPAKNAVINFEDIYLSNEDSMVVVKFNPSITNFKYVVQESITNTLGGKYPVIRKNGDTKYRQFNLSGSIYIEGSVNIVEKNDSASNNSITNMDNFFVDEYCLFSTKINPLNATANTQKEVIETRGRRFVMDFLCDNRPKLFRSAEEGNMIVYLSNISFTPNKQLGRHLYDFSATVNEVCDYTIDNLKKYKLNLGGYIAANVICTTASREPVTIKNS